MAGPIPASTKSATINSAIPVPGGHARVVSGVGGSVRECTWEHGIIRAELVRECGERVLLVGRQRHLLLLRSTAQVGSSTRSWLSALREGAAWQIGLVQRHRMLPVDEGEEPVDGGGIVVELQTCGGFSDPTRWEHAQSMTSSAVGTSCSAVAPGPARNRAGGWSRLQARWIRSVLVGPRNHLPRDRGPARGAGPSGAA